MMNNKSRYIIAFFLTIAIGLSIGCAYPDLQKPPVRNYLRDVMVRTERPPEPERITVERLDEKAAALRGDGEVSPDAYILGKGDGIAVTVMIAGRTSAELKLETTVTGEGNIRCPLLGEVRVEGMPVFRVREKMTELYADGYYARPIVEVSVTEYRSRRAMITGLVSKPGNYPVIGERISLLHLLIEAEGLDEGAGDMVTITRSGPKTGGDLPDANPSGLHTEQVNLDRLVREGDMRHNIWVYPGDIVHVRPEKPAGYFQVLGFVNRPGAYELPGEREGELMLMDAIASAGGLQDAARAQYTYLVREEAGESRVYQIDLARIADAKEPDIPVRANDRIIASTDIWRRSIDGLLHAIRLERLTPRY